jgi:orotate phosphoribosyltransferase-like protein
VVGFFARQLADWRIQNDRRGSAVVVGFPSAGLPSAALRASRAGFASSFARASEDESARMTGGGA